MLGDLQMFPSELRFLPAKAKDKQSPCGHFACAISSSRQPRSSRQLLSIRPPSPTASPTGFTMFHPSDPFGSRTLRRSLWPPSKGRTRALRTSHMSHWYALVACRWNSENSPVPGSRGAECVSPPTQEPVWS